jgi:hypothetical protein
MESLEYLANDKYISKDVYKQHYPTHLRMDMLQYAMESNINPDKQRIIAAIMDDQSMNDGQRFNAFIDILSDDDLCYLGW